MTTYGEGMNFPQPGEPGYYKIRVEQHRQRGRRQWAASVVAGIMTIGDPMYGTKWWRGKTREHALAKAQRWCDKDMARHPISVERVEYPG